MASPTKRSPAAIARPVLILAVLGVVAFLIWRNATRREAYTGGNVETTGTIEAVHVRLGFKITGRIAEIGVSEGTVVAPGQAVARLETEDLDLALQTARASREVARAVLVQARAARERSSRDRERQQMLLQRGATTVHDADVARTNDEAVAGQVQAAEAQVHQAESAVAQAALQRSYAELRAPEAGQVSEVIHRPGEMVVLGTPVITIAQLDTVKVHAAVDETKVGAVRPGDRVRVRVYTFDRTVFEGQVTDIQPAGDFATRKDWGAQRRDIRTFSVTARVPNPDRLLKDGMTADVTILPGQAARRMAEAKP
jgi:HlyD family secretion protein